MMKHLRYLRYLLRHKWHVLVACARAKLFWRGVMHDLSKFFPSEWGPYASYFYGGPHRPLARFTTYEKTYFWDSVVRLCKESVQDRFDHAWLLHQRRNPHHWQSWILREDSGGLKVLPMPRACLQEMVCDWRGASRAQGHGDDLVGWYTANRHKMQLHPETRREVEGLVGVVPEAAP